jgi:hypothetical protein
MHGEGGLNMTLGIEWARQDSNLRPTACKAGALPLSYAPRSGANGDFRRIEAANSTFAPEGKPISGQLLQRVPPALLVTGVAGAVVLREAHDAVLVDEERAAEGEAEVAAEHAV